MNRIKLLLLLLTFSLLSAKQSERHYQTQYAIKIGGKTEVVMKDGSRCDIVTRTHAIEVDFAKKWAEAIGQNLNYSLNTGKRAGIALILETQSDDKHLVKLKTVVRHHGLKIDVYPLYGSDYQTPKLYPLGMEGYDWGYTDRYSEKDPLTEKKDRVFEESHSKHYWSDKKGRTIEAEFIRFHTNKVVVMWNGKIVPLPLESLSFASQRLAASLRSGQFNLDLLRKK